MWMQAVLPFSQKGFTEEAARRASVNVQILHSLVSAETPLIGIEPSALLTVRDSYPDLVGDNLVEKAREIASHTLLFDEYLVKLIEEHVLTGELFAEKKRDILLHGHCHQKALASVDATRRILAMLPGANVKVLPTGCCGMAGSFGYEREHYDLSLKIGELALFPLLRAASESTYIAAPGTSCRAQISGSLGREAYHPIELLYDALKPLNESPEALLRPL